MKEAASKAQLPSGTCLYTLRHSFITQALLDGVSTLEVSRIAGTSLAMIEKHYAGVLENWDGIQIPAEDQIRAARRRLRAFGAQ